MLRHLAVLVFVLMTTTAALLAIGTTTQQQHKHRMPSWTRRHNDRAAANLRHMNVTTSWNCTVLRAERVGGASSPIKWEQLSCTGSTPFAFAGTVGPIVVNIAQAPINHPRVRVSPLHASKARSQYGLQTLSDMIVDANGRNSTITTMPKTTYYAAINGGFFFELNNKHFFDDVCFGKTAEEARQPLNASEPIYGRGDCLSVKNGVFHSFNCGKKSFYGYNRPTVLVINQSVGMNVYNNQSNTNGTHIVTQQKDDPPPPGVTDAIASGPNLVSYDPISGESFIDIPKDDENVNILGRSANAGLGLRQEDSKLFLVTFNGNGGCELFNTSCGINSFPMAGFFKDYLKVDVAMSLDQGGSTTMVIGKEGRAVSCTARDGCSAANPNLRLIFDGLAIGLVE